LGAHAAKSAARDVEGVAPVDEEQIQGLSEM